MLKECIACHSELPVERFNVNRGNKDGRQARCRQCMRTWRFARAEKLRAYDRARRCEPRWKANKRRKDLQKYGLSPDAYDALLAKQAGSCAICHETSDKKLAVDHCHRTQRVRGLLCARCNLGIGMFRDDPVRLRGAIQYLVQNDG